MNDEQRAAALRLADELMRVWPLQYLAIDAAALLRALAAEPLHERDFVTPPTTEQMWELAAEPVAEPTCPFCKPGIPCPMCIGEKQSVAEPVAWMYDEARYRPTDLRGQQWMPRLSKLPPYNDPEMVRGLTPLYTHPQQGTEQDDDLLTIAHMDGAHAERKRWELRAEHDAFRIRDLEARYMALLKQVADGEALKPRPPIIVQQDTALREAAQAVLEIVSGLSLLALCEDLYHPKKDQHPFGDECPVAKRAVQSIERLRGVLEAK